MITFAVKTKQDVRTGTFIRISRRNRGSPLNLRYYNSIATRYAVRRFVAIGLFSILDTGKGNNLHVVRTAIGYPASC